MPMVPGTCQKLLQLIHMVTTNSNTLTTAVLSSLMLKLKVIQFAHHLDVININIQRLQQNHQGITLFQISVLIMISYTHKTVKILLQLNLVINGNGNGRNQEKLLITHQLNMNLMLTCKILFLILNNKKEFTEHGISHKKLYNLNL